MAGQRRTLRDWVSSLPVTVALLLVVFLSAGNIIHSQLLRVGQATWNDYFQLRHGNQLSQPHCNRNPDIQARVRRILKRRKAQAKSDSLNALLGASTNASDIRQSLLLRRSQCRQQWQAYRNIKQRLTPAVRIYSAVEMGVASAISLTGSYNRLLLCLLLVFCAATATVSREHFAIRPPRTRRDHFVSTGAQLVANLLLLTSAIAYRQEEVAAMHSGVPAQFFYLHAFWIAGFAFMSAVSAYQLLRPPPGLEPGGAWSKAALTVPLYTLLCLVAGGWFFSQGFYEGIGVYTDSMMELAEMLLNLALYVWAGMLLRQTRLADLIFDVLRPWELSPELLCLAVLAVSAVLSAYTGASGAYVMAAGATVYAELVRAGSRRSLALAATAMSGSLGVVLTPCLMVVIIAAINGSVTTTALFASGLKMFAITLGLFLVIALLLRRTPLHVATPRRALPDSLRAGVALLPYAAVILLVVGFFRFVLQCSLNEFTAPVMLPIILLGILVYEARLEPRLLRLSARATPQGAPPRPPGLEQRLRRATGDTTCNIGGLLMLVALSVSFGGIVQHSGVMQDLPNTFSSVWVAMSLLVPTMIAIGMFMDPYGAIILVNAVIAPLAYHNGITPLHFWIIALVSFELGYLTPPVALNQLLARAVIGDEEVEAIGRGEITWWRRHEHRLLPILVLLSALLLVAYLPLASTALHHWLFQPVSLPQ